MIIFIGILRKGEVHLITLLRHGESEGNISGILQGQSDYPLTPLGIEQAQCFASAWKSEGTRLDLIISSPLKRASQTSEIIASALKARIEYDPAWKERNFGHLQGIRLEEINQRNPPVDFFHPYDPIGGYGESQVDLFTRASLALQNVLRQPAGSYLIVSHGGILNKALFVIMGITPQGHYNSLTFHFGNTGYAQLIYNSSTRRWAVLSFNSPSKLSMDEDNDSWKSD